VTFGQREKEESADYRYFPDPDLMPVSVSPAHLDAVRRSLPEMPAARRSRFIGTLGLSEYDADVILDQGPALAGWYEEVVRACGDGKLAANWVTQDVLRDLKEGNLTLDEFPIPPAVLGTLLQMIATGRVTTRSAREIYAALKELATTRSVPQAGDITRLIAERGLEVVRDTGALQQAIAAVIAAKPEAVADFRAGKQAAVGPLIGMIMKQAAGADPKQVREMLIAAIQS
jgi:aspartyl-tRNA(Asn)/glutamyl-tRNA(Gln) amidotransferase subunit B